MVLSVITTSAWALPNPASVFCTQQKGKLTIVSDKDGGQSGVCKIGNAYIEEWTLYRAANEKNRTPSLATRAFNMYGGYHDSAKDGSELCHQLGGIERAVTAPSLKKPLHLCGYDQDSGPSAIGIDTLWEGPKVHKKLSRLIKE